METDERRGSPPGADPAVSDRLASRLLTGRQVTHRSVSVRAGDPGSDTGDQMIQVIGTVDVRSAGTLRTLLHAAIDCGMGPLRVHVGDLELGDHAGIGVLLGSARRARAVGRPLVLVDVPSAVRRLLPVDRLGRLLRFEETFDRRPSALPDLAT